MPDSNIEKIFKNGDKYLGEWADIKE